MYIFFLADPFLKRDVTGVLSGLRGRLRCSAAGFGAERFALPGDDFGNLRRNG